MIKKLTLPVCLICVLLSLTSLAQNTALSFNGTNTYVSTSAYVVPGTGDFTVEFWGYIASLGSGFREFVSQGSSAAGQAFYIGTNLSNNDIRCGDPWQVTGVPMPINQWTHIALVRSGTSASLYLNGVLKATTTGYTISTGGTNFILGNQYGGLNEYINGKIDELRIWNIARTVAQIKSGLFGTVAVNATGLVAYYHMNEGSGTVLGNSTAAAGLNGTLVNSPAWVSSPVQGASNALAFDGVNDQVVVPANTLYDLSTGTIECWVKPGALTGNATILGVRGTGGTRYSFHMSTSVIGLWNGVTFLSIPFTSTPGQWYHLAFVSNGTNTIVYIDGNNTGTINESFGTLTGQPFVIGIAKNSGGDGEPFAGSIDEVRIWNTLLTQTQIQTNKDNTLTGTEAGLVGLFSFDQGNATNDNSSLVIAIDKTANSNHGTLSNFALTGSTSNWITHALVVLPVILTRFDVHQNGIGALIQWQTAQEQNSLDFSIQRSPDGALFTAIGSVPAGGNTFSLRNYSFIDPAPHKGRNFYRLKQSDMDGKFIYSGIRLLDISPIGGLSWYISGARTVEINLQQGNNENYRVTDISGRILKQGQLSSGKTSLSTLPGGIYIIKIEKASGELHSKLLVP